MTERKYRKGAILMKKGDPADETFLTVTGNFLVSKINSNCRRDV
jgi:CRP-like cAMP-binding protein